ncbi:MAG: glycosyl transferase [Robiginitomaculum sp.]|nr:MAG: glycosyl transferase [Robiginitomaculum sp.]
MSKTPTKLPCVHNNAAWPHDTAIVLSVLIPFYKDNPQKLLRALGQNPPLNVEVILYDDGSADPDLSSAMDRATAKARLPVKLISAYENVGRSGARNALIKAARGQWVLFLDADMMPEDDQFLRTWMACTQNDNPAIAFGGFSVPPLGHIAPEMILHQAFSQNSDCLPAAERAQNPAKHVCTSNLLVRRDVLNEHPFDNGFSGWGWEDVEWAARAARDYNIHHIDNPAQHLGLESAETLVRRFRDSAPNYARFVKRHPDLASTLPSWKAAHVLRNVPGLALVRPVFSAMARDTSGLVPLSLRILALKLWRSCWYAKALS